MQFLQPGENPDEHAFREAATWPDVVKSPRNPLERTEDHHNWHYVDYPLDRDGKDGPRPPEQWDGHSVPTDLLQAMQMVTAAAPRPGHAAPRQAIDLCWVMHLVGDVHQPLHAVSLYSNTYPTGDQGGNLIHVGTDGNPDTNLHSVWDGLEGRSNEPGVIRKIADRLEKEHPESSRRPPWPSPTPRPGRWRASTWPSTTPTLDGKLNGVTRDQAQAKPRQRPASCRPGTNAGPRRRRPPDRPGRLPAWPSCCSRCLSSSTDRRRRATWAAKDAGDVRRAISARPQPRGNRKKNHGLHRSHRGRRGPVTRLSPCEICVICGFNSFVHPRRHALSRACSSAARQSLTHRRRPSSCTSARSYGWSV